MFTKSTVISFILILQLAVFVKNQNYESENYCDKYFQRCNIVCSSLTKNCVRKITSINNNAQVIIEDSCDGELATRNIYTRKPNKRSEIRMVCRLYQESDFNNVQIESVHNTEIHGK